MNSNFTLRFPRTSKEVYGDWARFNDPEAWDRRIFIVALIGAAFVIGMMIGGLV
jgi:hypothetical protein